MPGIYLRLNGLPAPDAARAPLLERLLARSGSAGPAEDWRSDAFRLVAPVGHAMPGVAPSALRAELGRVDAGTIFIATPLHCEAGMVSVRLPPDGVVALNSVEAGEIARLFNADFAASGQRLVAGDSGRLYCVLTETLHAMTRDPLDVRGRDIGQFQPAGVGGPRLRRLASEIEMWLHDHALNRARTAAGRVTITGLWLWGGGEPVGELPQLAGWTAGDDPLFGAWPAQAVFPAEPRAGVVVVATAPGSPQWPAVESSWLAPALAALRTGRATQLAVSIGNRAFLIRRGWSWRIWRRPRPWWESLG